MKKGGIFETVIHIIQESLKDSRHTNITQNLKLIDNIGLEREFDVLIESEVNNFQVKIAIECKDYSRKIGIDKIEGFETKCNAIPSISKKVFISRMGFQSGAISKAKIFGIELLTLEKINEIDVSSWLQINIPIPISIERRLARYGVEFVGDFFNLKPDDLLIIEFEGGFIQKTIFEFTRDWVETNLPKYPLRVRTADVPLTDIDVLSFKVDFPLAFLSREEQKCQIRTLWFDVEYVYSRIEGEVAIDKFRHFDSSKDIAQTVTLITENQDIFSLVKRTDRHEIEILSKVTIEEVDKFVKIAELKIEKNA